jgi:hypothetical protein
MVLGNCEFLYCLWGGFGVNQKMWLNKTKIRGKNIAWRLLGVCVSLADPRKI